MRCNLQPVRQRSLWTSQYYSRSGKYTAKLCIKPTLRGKYAACAISACSGFVYESLFLQSNLAGPCREGQFICGCRNAAWPGRLWTVERQVKSHISPHRFILRIWAITPPSLIGINGSYWKLGIKVNGPRPAWSSREANHVEPEWVTLRVTSKLKDEANSIIKGPLLNLHPLTNIWSLQTNRKWTFWDQRTSLWGQMAYDGDQSGHGNAVGSHPRTSCTVILHSKLHSRQASGRWLTVWVSKAVPYLRLFADSRVFCR